MDTFLLTPLREGRRRSRIITSAISSHFYSRPCGRGDASTGVSVSLTSELFLLTPLREGRRDEPLAEGIVRVNFYSRPCGRGDLRRNLRRDCGARNFYSRPCGRGDSRLPAAPYTPYRFLLTPLREGRPRRTFRRYLIALFLLTPLREGRQNCAGIRRAQKCISTHAPAGGATMSAGDLDAIQKLFLLTPLREGRQRARTM